MLINNGDIDLTDEPAEEEVKQRKTEEKKTEAQPAAAAAPASTAPASSLLTQRNLLVWFHFFLFLYSSSPFFFYTINRFFWLFLLRYISCINSKPGFDSCIRSFSLQMLYFHFSTQLRF